MSTTRYADDDVIDRVVATLHAVAEATPVDAGPARAPGDDALVLVPLREEHHPRAVRRRTVRLVMAAAAAAVLVAAVLTVRHDGGDDAPTDLADQPAALPVHMEATWLPSALASTDGMIDRTRALGAPVVAVMWGAGDAVVAVAAVEPGDDAHPDQVRTATERVGGALADLVDVAGADTPVTTVDGGRGAAVAAGPEAAVDARALAARVAAGTAPADARPGEPAPRPLPVDWLGGVGPTVAVTHQAADQSASLGIVTVGATLPDADVVEALVSGAGPAEVRGHDGWQYPMRDGDVYAVTWQERPGVVVTVAGSGLRPAEIEAVADGLVAVDEPAGGSTGDAVATGTVGGRDYRIEAEPPEATGGRWCATLVLDGEQVARVCESRDGVTGIFGLDPVATYEGGAVSWGAVPSGTATVRVEGEADGAPLGEAEAIEVAAPGDGSEGLRVAVVAVPLPVRDGDDVTFRFFDAEGEGRGSSTWTDLDGRPPAG